MSSRYESSISNGWNNNNLRKLVENFKECEQLNIVFPSCRHTYTHSRPGRDVSSSLLGNRAACALSTHGEREREARGTGWGEKKKTLSTGSAPGGYAARGCSSSAEIRPLRVCTMFKMSWGEVRGREKKTMMIWTHQQKKKRSKKKVRYSVQRSLRYILFGGCGQVRANTNRTEDGIHHQRRRKRRNPTPVSLLVLSFHLSSSSSVSSIYIYV